MSAPPDPIDPELVEPRLEHPIRGPVLWFPEVGSTNDEAARLARAGAHEGTVVGADHQTAGRGRRGRAWVEGPGRALLVSVVLRPPLAAPDAGLLPVVAAVAVADAVEALGAREVSIAWPNDVLVGGGKVAGILCELSAGRDGVAWAVAGVGLNVRPAPPLDGVRWPPTSLQEAGVPVARGEALVALLVALARAHRGWVAGGAAPVLDAFARRDHLRGRGVLLDVSGGPVEGEALGVDALGRLRVATAEGERALASGEVTRVHPAEAPA